MSNKMLDINPDEIELGEELANALEALTEQFFNSDISRDQFEASKQNGDSLKNVIKFFESILNHTPPCLNPLEIVGYEDQPGRITIKEGNLSFDFLRKGDFYTFVRFEVNS